MALSRTGQVVKRHGQDKLIPDSIFLRFLQYMKKTLVNQAG